MSNFRRFLGQNGEKLAQTHIKKLGYKILTTNYRIRNGEVDIIAKDNDVLVFLEVKSRKSTSCGTPLSSITWRKQKKISGVALEYILRNNLVDTDARFDVISVTWDSTHSPRIEHIQNAFDLCSHFI